MMNKDKKQTYDKINYARDPEGMRARARLYHKRRRDAVVELLGGKCVRCGFDDDRALQVDHINGGGCQEKSSTTGIYYNFVINQIKSGDHHYQLLCANCNWIKRFENRETNHL